MKTKVTRSFNMRPILVGFGVVFAGSLSLQAATTVDLTTAGAGGSANGAFFRQVSPQPTGTGVIDPFVRVSQANTPVVEGYNATVRPVMPHVITDPNFTHDLRFGAVPQVVNPVGASPGTYLQFLLDINQTGANPQLSLHELEIYTRPAGQGPLTTANTYLALTGNANLRWDLDVGPQGDSLVQLNYSLNNGSGSGDMFAYIPLSAFGSVSANDFLYLYSSFGVPSPNNDGFEEWAVLRANTVPDGGSTIALMGVALMLLAGLSRRGLLVAAI